MNKLNKKRLCETKFYLMITALFIFMFIVGAGFSYAFFSTTTRSKEYFVYTGNLKVDFASNGGNTINMTGIPTTDSNGLSANNNEYSFKVVNNGSIDARYQVRLELDDTVSNVPIKSIKLAYKKNDGTYSNPVLLSDLNSNLVFTTNNILSVQGEDTIYLKLWVDINSGNDIQGKTFKARIVIDSIQNVEDGYVVDTKPIIVLNGNDINLKTGDTFTDPGVLEVKDDKDIVDLSEVTKTYEYYDGTNLTTVSSIDTNTRGVYYITYSVTDSSNNTGSIIRVVTVNDNTPPTITLNGDTPLTMSQYDTFTDPGVTVDTNNRVVTLGEVKTSVPGTYTIRYIVIDQNNNMNSVTRTVNVIEKRVWEFAFDPDEDGEGQEQIFTVPYDGNYKLEVWGAQGGNANETFIGGYGGYSAGLIELSRITNLYINVGGKGNTNNVGQTDGGYNGGGYTHETRNATDEGSGGGATHIALKSGLLSSLQDYKGELIDDKYYSSDYILIVAGGGGGASYYKSGSGYDGSGGSGGGYNGVDGYYDTHAHTGKGGTQISGGASNVDGNGNTSSYPSGFGFGSYANGTNLSVGTSGGGGGFYGGGAGVHSGAGGGSGYIGNAGLTDKAMYCYDCTEATNTETDTEIFTVSTTGTTEYVDTTNCPNGYSSDPVSKCAKAGNGYVRITYMGE